MVFPVAVRTVRRTKRLIAPQPRKGASHGNFTQINYFGSPRFPGLDLFIAKLGHRDIIIAHSGT